MNFANCVYTLSVSLSICITAQAQYSDDPATNLTIAQGSGDQVQVKIVPTADGGCYLSWFDSYDVYLQRLDASGNEQWPQNGILIANRPYSSTMDYGLDIDAAGYAILAFRQQIDGIDQMMASRIAPDGTLIWGIDGVILSDNPGDQFIGPAKITGTTDGKIIVAWPSNGTIKIQALDEDASIQWQEPITLADDNGGEFWLCDMHATIDGSFIFSWVRKDPPIFASKHIWAQKYSSHGSMQWPPTHVRVFDSGSLQIGNFPYFKTDGNGGAVFSWYDTSGNLQVYAQHILSDGTEAFGHNGSIVSTAPRQRVSPNATYNQETQETFVFWTEHHNNQSDDGVYGQKFDAVGNRQWSDSGIVVQPASPTVCFFVRTVPYADGAMVFFLNELSFGNTLVRASRVDTNGNLVWPGDVLSASTVASSKGRLFASSNTCGSAILAWHDERNGTNDIIAQNVNIDGTLGIPEIPGDIDNSGSVSTSDLLILLSNWGDCADCKNCPADLDNDCNVGTSDLLILLANWGSCP